MKVLIFSTLLVFMLLLFTKTTKSQSFLNGNFELTSASVGNDEINLSNDAWNQKMRHSRAFGTYGDMDIISTGTYNGMPQDGSFFVAFTGGGTDAISMDLSSPVKQGETYTISFWDRASSSYTPQPFEIGLSNDPLSFGTPVYTGGLPVVGVWTERTFTFTAPVTAKYITVQLSGANNIGDWAQADNFKFVDTRNSITTLKTRESSFCACSDLVVAFRAEGSFDPGNIFSVELSDERGSFDHPVLIGSFSGNGLNEEISCQLPCDLEEGSAYRIRVVSSAPAITGSDNGENLRINTKQTPSVSISVSPGGEVKNGTTLVFSADISGAGENPSCEWLVNGEVKSTSSGSFSSSSLKDGDVVSMHLTSDHQCSIGEGAASNEIIVSMIEEEKPEPPLVHNDSGQKKIRKHGLKYYMYVFKSKYQGKQSRGKSGKPYRALKKNKHTIKHCHKF